MEPTGRIYNTISTGEHLMANDTPDAFKGNRKVVQKPSIISGPSHGVITRLGPNGGFTYIPNDYTHGWPEGFDGTDSFDYLLTAKHGTSTDTATATITFGNFAPYDLSLDATSVDENQPVGTVVGQLSTLDPDNASGHTYELVAGKGSGGNSSFRIVGDQLQTAKKLNHEKTAKRNIRVRVTDSAGDSYVKRFTIDVRDVNEAPRFRPGRYGSAANRIMIGDGKEAGNTVITVGAVDPDAGDTLTYSLKTNPGGMYAIDSSSGKITLAKDASETPSDKHIIRVQVRDAGSPQKSDIARVFVQYDLSEIQIEAASDEALSGATYLGLIDGNLTFSADAKFRVTATLSSTAESSDDVLISIFGDGMLIDQYQAPIMPGQTVSDIIAVDVKNFSSIRVVSSFVQQPAIEIQHDEPILELKWKFGPFAGDQTVLLSEFKELANSGVRVGTKALLKEIFERDDAISELTQMPEWAGNPQGAGAHYDQMIDGFSEQFENTFAPRLGQMIDKILPELPGGTLRVGKAFEADFLPIISHLDSVSAAIAAPVNGQDLSDAFKFKFATKTDLGEALVPELKEALSDFVKGHDPSINGSELFNQLKDANMILGVGLEKKIDITPGNASDALGTLFIGSGPINYRLFEDEDWKQLERLQILLEQPPLQIGGISSLQFGVNGTTDFNGNYSGDMSAGIRF